MDYGDCGGGRGPADIAYFLSQSLDPRLCGTHEKQLLRLYYDTLTRQGKTMTWRGEGREGNEVASGYSWEECWRDYRLAVLYYWVLAVNVASHVRSPDKSDRVYRLAKVMATRSLGAIIRLDCLDLIKT